MWILFRKNSGVHGEIMVEHWWIKAVDTIMEINISCINQKTVDLPFVC